MISFLMIFFKIDLLFYMEWFMDHPTLKSFRFCPGCGSSKIIFLDCKLIECKQCNFNLFLNPATAVSVVLYNEKNEILIATRAKNPGIDLLDLPGGFVDPFETAEEASIREIKEELNVEIKDLSYISTGTNVYLYDHVEYQTVDIGYSSFLPSNVLLTIDPELKKIEWIPYQNIKKNTFAFASAFLILQKFINLKYNYNLEG